MPWFASESGAKIAPARNRDAVLDGFALGSGIAGCGSMTPELRRSTVSREPQLPKRL